MTFARTLIDKDMDDMNLLHYTIFDNDIIKVQALEKETIFGYYATLDSVIKVSRKRREAAKNSK